MGYETGIHLGQWVFSCCQEETLEGATRDEEIPTKRSGYDSLGNMLTGGGGKKGRRLLVDVGPANSRDYQRKSS